jgi:imidazolonepropionase-like amidohydrolase
MPSLAHPGCLQRHLSLVVQGGKIRSTNAQVPPEGAVVLNCGGLLLMPGLCDAHVHVTATSANLAAAYGLSEALVTARAVDILEGMIQRGFTTVRDAGGVGLLCCKAGTPVRSMPASTKQSVPRPPHAARLPANV